MYFVKYGIGGKVDFLKLRFLNVFFLFVIGIALGFLFANAQKGKSSSYPVPAVSSAYPTSNIPVSSLGKKDKIVEASLEQNSPNPMDDDEDYQLSLVEENIGPYTNLDEENNSDKKDKNSPSVKKDDSQDFFSSPIDFKGKEVYIKAQMLTTKKTEKGLCLNFVYSSKDKNPSYLYVDDLDNISGENPDYRIGYFYNVSFLCNSGELRNNNKLISISFSGEKAPWSTGVSAIE